MVYIISESCLSLCNTMDCSLPGSSVHGILQARILEWVAIPFSRGSSWPRDWTCVSCISRVDRGILYHWAIWEGQDVVYAHNKILLSHKKNGNFPFATMWVDLEGIMSTEVSQTEKNKFYIFTYLWNLKNKIYKTGPDS